MIALSELITGFRGSNDFASCHVWRVNGKAFPTYKAAKDYVKENRKKVEAEYLASIELLEAENHRKWKAEAKVLIARVLVKNGNRLPDVWQKLYTLTDKELGMLEACAKSAPQLLTAIK